MTTIIENPTDVINQPPTTEIKVRPAEEILKRYERVSKEFDEYYDGKKFNFATFKVKETLEWVLCKDLSKG